jgi:hypothetical protein
MITKKVQKKGKKTATLKRFELWHSREQGYSFFPAGNESARALLPTDARRIKVIQAKSWEEAQTKKHRYLALEPYKPAQ